MELVTAVLGDHGQRPQEDYGTVLFFFHKQELWSLAVYILVGSIKMFCESNAMNYSAQNSSESKRYIWKISI